MRRSWILGASLALGLAAGVHVVGSDTEGGGGYPPPLNAPELSPEERREIEGATASNIAKLRAEGRLAEPTADSVLFSWPVAPWNGNPLPDSWGISNYVDQNPAFPNQLLDYFCGNRTYDTTGGYNHSGIDIFTWPWPWKEMDENLHAVVATAPGTIVFRSDGFFDMSCSTSGGQWNAVYVRHADGSIAWYGHMKKNSVTPKGVGDTVVTGEYLGIVGSSGNSTGPHLHFEVWEDETYTQLIDAYDGPCNSLNPTSWWASQRPYTSTKILRMTTGAQPPSHPDCPGIEVPNEQKDFTAPATIRFTSYYRDHLLGQTTLHEVFAPGGSLFDSWSFENTFQYLNASWWWQARTIPAGSPSGTYTWRATHDGQTYEYLFNVGVAGAGAVPRMQSEGTPLRVAKAGSGVTLSWGDSCKSSDSDFDVYQGTLGATWSYNHVKRQCGTAGAKTWTITTLAPGNLYWLVVPRSAQRDGSYGTDSLGNERPQPTAPLQRCALRLFDCP